jgi:DHA1 family multidrug/chloramphenicol efflux transport protein-like MFS transporter
MRRLYLFAVFLVLYEFTAYSANDMIMPGMLAVVNEFNAPLSYVALSLSLYMLGECVIQLWLGPMAERFGKRRIILCGNFTFLVFTLVIATSQNIHQFMLGRWLQGSGMAFIAMGYALIHEKFDDKTAVKLIAIMGNVSILAPLVGPLIGGLIVSKYNWNAIFILTGVLGLITLIGLYRYTPPSQPRLTDLKLVPILRHYLLIAKDPVYRLGVLSTTMAAMPLLIWIGLAPNLILHNLKLGYSSYIIYQMISISGLVFSSILVQFLAGKWKFAQLIYRGSFLSFTGLIVSFIGHASITVLSLGLLIYCLGFGIANGSIYRIIMSNSQVSQSMAASLMTFSQTLLYALGIQLTDYIASFSNYSALSFTSACLISGSISLCLNTTFAKRVINRSWQ